jgi:hypothetical protein
MLRVLAACLLLVCALPRSAEAEWQLTPFVGLTFRGSTSLADPETVDNKPASERVHKHFGGAVSFLGSGILGVETIFNWTPGFFEQGDLDLVGSSRSIAWMGNVVLTAPRRLTEYSLRPYVSGGFGLIKPYVRLASTSGTDPLPSVDLNLAGYNIGGGAVGFLSTRTGLRFDLRYFSTIRPTEHEGVPTIEERVRLRYMTASVGIVFRR